MSLPPPPPPPPCEHPGAQGTGCWHRPTLGGPWDAAVDAIGLSAHAPDMQARHPEDWGPRKPPSSRFLLLHILRGEAAASLRVSTATPACPPLKNSNPWRLAQAPAHPARGASARGACPPSRRHSGTRHRLDGNSNLAGRADSGHPWGLLGSDHAGPAGKSCWGITKCHGSCWSLPLTLLASLCEPPSFSASHVPHCLQKDPS